VGRFREYWRAILVGALLVALDFGIVAQIMGISYLPFSWTSLARADEPSVYNLWIEDLEWDGDFDEQIQFFIFNGAGITRIFGLQGTTNLASPDWTLADAPQTSSSPVMIFRDLDLTARHKYYRVISSPAP